MSAYLSKTQDTDATASDDTLESRTGRAPGGGSEGAGHRCSAVIRVAWNQLLSH
jgi:hypothetical protein